MKINTTNNASATPPQDWPLSAAKHKIENAAAQDMINAFKPAGFGAYFTINTINGLITPANAGIRYYFTLYKNRVTVMLTGVQKIDIAKYDDLFNAKLAINDSLNFVASNVIQSITLADASLCNRNYRASANFADARKGGMFGIEAVRAIIMQNGCAGIRFYFAKDAGGIKTTVIYGVDGAGNNLTAYVGDQNCPCPNYCGAVNSLNS